MTQSDPRLSVVVALQKNEFRSALAFALLLVSSAGGCAELAGELGGVVGASAVERELAEGSEQARAELRLVGLRPIGVYESGVLGEGAAEITAFDPDSARLFVVNGASAAIDVLDLSVPSSPVLIESLDLSPYGAAPTSVDVARGVVAVAVTAEPSHEAGAVVLFSAAGLEYINHLRVGSLPDMLTFSPDHSKIVVACEGEPAADYMIDPEGSVAIIDLGLDLGAELGALSEGDVTLAGFEAFERDELDEGVRIYGPGSSLAQDLEPEFVAISADSKTAWVSLQENNALALVDLDAAEITGIVGLGFKDHAQPGNGLDLDDSDAHLEIHSWPVLGMYQPDALARFSVGGRDYVLSANEGEARRYAELDEQVWVRDLVLDPGAFPRASALQRAGALGDLAVSALMGDVDGDQDYDRLYTFGTRSVSVWSAAGELVWDSGEQIERVVADRSPSAAFVEHATEPELGRSGGPRPEGVVSAELWGRPYAFVGLERAGGIVAYDLSQPDNPAFVLFEHETCELQEHADLGPEGLEIVSAHDSPSGAPLLLVANEISGTVRVYELVSG